MELVRTRIAILIDCEEQVYVESSRIRAVKVDFLFLKKMYIQRLKLTCENDKAYESPSIREVCNGRMALIHRKERLSKR